MEQIHLDRLLELADFIEKLEPKQWDYGDFLREDACGTVGCAIGWAAFTPTAKALNVEVRPWKRLPDGKLQTLGWSFDGENYVSASVLAQYLYGLNYDDYEYLFIPCSYDDEPNRNNIPGDASQFEVAEHIRDFVRSGRP
jgi:hypothetical protein